MQCGGGCITRIYHIYSLTTCTTSDCRKSITLLITWSLDATQMFTKHSPGIMIQTVCQTKGLIHVSEGMLHIILIWKPTAMVADYLFLYMYYWY